MGNLTILPALIPADYDAYAAAVAEAKVTMVEIAGGSPKKYINLFHSNGVKVLHKSATLRHALKAIEAGVDIVEIVGYEGSIAGGQPGDEIGLWVALTKAIKVIDGRVPIVAAGACATGVQLAAALSMGASGMTMATRFLATKEAPIHESIKAHLAQPSTDERQTTIVLSKLSNATRVFKNSVTAQILEKEDNPAGVDFSQIAPLASGQRTKHMWQQTGEWDDSMWSCGQSVGLIDDVPTCQELIERIVGDAEKRLVEATGKIIVKSKM